jgi:hypothetical protein
MRELLMTLDRYVYFSGLIAAGALTLGIIDHGNGYDWLTLVFAPYAIGLSYIYLIQIFTEIERSSTFVVLGFANAQYGCPITGRRRFINCRWS